MAPAAFFRVPCTHRIMYTVQCVYRALSERDSGRTDGCAEGPSRPSRARGKNRRREMGEEEEEGEKQRVKERERGKKGRGTERAKNSVSKWRDSLLVRL